MTPEYWIFLALNPEPWSIGELGVGRKNKKVYPYLSPNQQLKAYQSAVKEELQAQKIEMFEPGLYDLRFFFWRKLDQYSLPSGRKSQRHAADATNMQKALEDALQKTLIDNDRNVRRVSSEIVSQSVTTKPGIVIHAKQYENFDSKQIPSFMWDRMNKAEELPTDNTWAGPEEGVF